MLATFGGDEDDDENDDDVDDGIWRCSRLFGNQLSSKKMCT